MAVIATIEDTIVAALLAAFDNKVKIETVPAEITAEEWGQRLRAGTGIYVAFLTAGTDEAPGTARLVGDFVVYVVSESAGKEIVRRRGNEVRQGAYLMIEIAVPTVHDLCVKGIGTLQLVRITNLFSEEFDKLGLAVYAIQFRTQLAFDAAAALQDFLTFAPQFGLPFQTDPPSGPLPLPDDQAALDAQTILPGAST
jgi:phage gp37-like protein